MTTLVRDIFTDIAVEIPGNVRVSVGFPPRGAFGKRQVIGVCFDESRSVDANYEIFISPVIGEGLHAAETLVHELAHACLPLNTGHKKPFAKLCTRLGLEGHPTTTHAGEVLSQRLRALIRGIGAYPHAEITGELKKVQTTRMHRACCAACGYTVRLAKKWAAVGAPICPTLDHGAMVMELPSEEPTSE